MGVRHAPPSIASATPARQPTRRSVGNRRSIFVPRDVPLPATAPRSQRPVTRGVSPWIPALKERLGTVFMSIRNFVQDPRGESASAEPVQDFTPPTNWDLAWEELDEFDDIKAKLSRAAADGWEETFKKLEKVDHAREQGYKEGFDSLLVFAGLFSAIVTAFVTTTLTPLQTSSQSMTAALLHISVQLHDSTVPPLALRDSSSPCPTHVRVNVLWLISLVMSLMAAFLAILVKQWMHAYMSWTFLAPGKNAVALRQYRIRGWRKARVHRWHDGTPLLLQLALILFLCGLVDLLWHTQEMIVAAWVTAAVGLAFAGLLGVTLWPIWDAQCAYRSPLSSFLRRALSWMSWLLVQGLRAAIPAAIKDSAGESFLARLEVYNRRPYHASWDFWDLARMDEPLEAHVHAVDAASEVIARFTSHSVLATVTAGLFDRTGDSPWMPIQNLWPVLRGLLGDDAVSRELVLDVLKAEEPNQLNLPGSQLSAKFCEVVATLVRRAALHQQSCSPQDILHVRYAVDLTSVLVRAKPVVVPYHMTTLVLLLRREIPPELAQAAKRQLRDYKQSLNEFQKNIALSPWQSPNIIAFTEATIALLHEPEVNLARMLDAVIITLHLITVRRQVDEARLTSQHDLLKSLGARLHPHHRAAAPNDMRHDLCSVLLQLLATSRFSRGDVSIIPHGLAWTVAVRLGYVTQDPSLPPDLDSREDLSMSEAARVASIIRAQTESIHGPPPTPPLPTPEINTEDQESRGLNAKLPEIGPGVNVKRPGVIRHLHQYSSSSVRGTSSGIPSP